MGKIQQKWIFFAAGNSNAPIPNFKLLFHPGLFKKI